MSKFLILIPTSMERDKLQPRLAEGLSRREVIIELCGFGPVCAAAITMEKILQHQPVHVFLLGIAGGYGPTEVGSAHSFSQVAIDGIGAGQGDTFQTAEDMGWLQFPGDRQRANISDRIDINADKGPNLLTVCAAAGNVEQASTRAERFDAIAEDMEGFGVAMACRLCQTPLHIIRGISNLAGDRNHADWKIDEALDAAAQLLNKTIANMDEQ